MNKTALDKMKMRELAKSVGLRDTPGAQWKWAFRQLRNKNRMGAKEGDLMLSGDALDAAKEKIELVPTYVRQRMAEESRRHGHKREILFSGNTGNMRAGDEGSITLNRGEKAIMHSHPATPKADAEMKAAMYKFKVKAKNLGRLESEYYLNNATEYARTSDPVLSASPSGINYNHLSTGDVKHLQSVINGKAKRFRDPNTNYFLKREAELPAEIDSLVDKGLGFLSNKLTFGEKFEPLTVFSPEKGRYVKKYFGHNTPKAQRLAKEYESVMAENTARKALRDAEVNEASTRLKWHESLYRGGDAEVFSKNKYTGNIMSSHVTGVHAPRAKLPKGFRSVYFDGGFETLPSFEESYKGLFDKVKLKG